MRPVFYEIKRSTTSRFSVLMIVVIIGLSALISYEEGSLSSGRSAGRSAPGRSVSEISGYYSNGDSLTLLSLFYDENGKPATGINATATLNGNISTGQSTSPGVYRFELTAVHPVSKVSLNYSYKMFGFTTTSTVSISVNTTFHDFSGYTIASGIFSPKNSSNLGFMMFFVGQNGSLSPSVKTYIISTDLIANNFSSFTNNYSAVYTFSNFRYTAVFPSLQGNITGKLYAAVVTNSSLIPLPTRQFIGLLSTYSPFTPKDIESSFFSAEGSLLAIFIPLLAVFMAYFTYGKDRTTGVLESIIKRPITRGEAIRSRFFANSVVIASSIVAAIVISDLISYRYFHAYMPLSFLLYISWAYSVIGISFLAISYLFSHLVKSQGALLGSLIGLFMVFGLFWTVIFDVVMAALSISSSSTTYVTSSVIFNYLSPSGYPSLVQLFFTQRIGQITQSLSVNPAAFGVTQLYLFIAAVLWIAVPFVIAHELAIKRD